MYLKGTVYISLQATCSVHLVIRFAVRIKSDCAGTFDTITNMLQEIFNLVFMLPINVCPFQNTRDTTVSSMTYNSLFPCRCGLVRMANSSRSYTTVSSPTMRPHHTMLYGLHPNRTGSTGWTRHRRNIRLMPSSHSQGRDKIALISRVFDIGSSLLYMFRVSYIQSGR